MDGWGEWMDGEGENEETRVGRTDQKGGVGKRREGGSRVPLVVLQGVNNRRTLALAAAGGGRPPEWKPALRVLPRGWPGTKARPTKVPEKDHDCHLPRVSKGQGQG